MENYLQRTAHPATRRWTASLDSWGPPIGGELKNGFYYFSIHHRGTGAVPPEDMGV